MTRRRVIAVGAAATLLTVAIGLLSPSILARFDRQIYDVMLRTASRDVASDRVAIVALDDASLGEFGGWPWPRHVLGRLIDSLSAAGAAVIAADILLPQPDRAGVAGDTALTGAVRRSRVVMGYALTFGTRAEDFASRCALTPLPLVVVEHNGRASPLEQLFHPTSALCSLRSFNEAARATGFLNATPDADGILRRAPMVVSASEETYPALALAALVEADSARDIRLEMTQGGHPQLTINGNTVPLDGRGEILVRFHGAAQAFPHISAADVLAGRLDHQSVRGRIVFVGGTALGLGDVVSTPFDIRYPGVEVHATVAANVLGKNYVDIPMWALSVALTVTLLVGGLLTGIVAWKGVLIGGVIGTLGVGAAWIASAVGLASLGVFVSPVMPTVAGALGLALLTASGLGHEWRRAESGELRRKRTHLFAIESLTMLTETRDHATGMHVRRTREYARVLTKQLRNSPRFAEYLTDERVEAITQLAPLHDIGKVGIPDAVLLKPGALTDEEYAEMKKHPELGYQILKRAERESALDGASDRVVLQVAEDLVRTHHERWDGKGYPQGLAGDAIPIPGRIIAVIDVYDALVQPRVYHKAVSHNVAVGELKAGRGGQFDADVVDAFVAAQEEFESIAVRLRDEP